MLTLVQIRDKFMKDGSYKDGEFVLRHSRSQIRKAGERIRKGVHGESDLDILQEYRSAHVEPMKYVIHLLDECLIPVGNGILAARLKRLPTIIDKLTRQTLDGSNPNSIQITRMGDIAGCRVILKDIDTLIKFNSVLELTPYPFIEMKVNKNYLSNPKRTGYRGLHKQFRYNSQFDIEVQLRTQLQHTWSTAVEVVDLFEGTKLKTRPNEANPKWIEFFKILADMFAFKDKVKLHKDAFYAKDLEKMKCRLFELDSELSARTILNSFTYVNDYLEDNRRENSYAIISVENSEGSKKTIKLIFFTQEEKLDAFRYYTLLEQGGVNTVMVNMKDFSKLKQAYPNYMDGVSSFMKELNGICPPFI